MRFEILGPLRVEADGAGIDLPGNRARAVLALLVVAEGRAVSTERLIDQVWGDDLPANPANTLQHTVAQLRKVLEPGRARNEAPRILRSTDDGYLLALDDHELDARHFERLVDDATAALDDDRAAEALEAAADALALWRGPALAGVDDISGVEGERRRLTERRIDARLVALDAKARVEGPAAVVAELESLVVEHPRREGLWARLMTALYQVDRQTDALRTYQRAADSLAESGLTPSAALRELEQRILDQDGTLRPADRRTVPHNLPASTTSLVGREAELAQVGEALRHHRLVTLTGPGGSGKTSLALAASWATLDHHQRAPDTRQTRRDPTGRGPVGEDGVWLVRLDDLDDPSLLGATVADAVGMPESWAGELVENLTEHLGDRRLLIVLDNCEHLLDEVAALAAELLTSCAQVSILATSQAPLEISGEQRIPVPPLGLPGETGSPFAALDQSPAVELFLARAAAVAPELAVEGDQLDDDALAAVANIVTALDGLPLAIELAAARADLYTPSELARLLGQRFDLLDRGPRDAPARQQTLQAAVAWSLGLLSDDERLFVGRLSVFGGWFDAEAAAAVTDADPDETDRLLGALVVRSILWRRPEAGRSRFRLPETVRRLVAESPDYRPDPETLQHLRLAHARFYADRVTEADRRLIGSDQARAFALLVADSDNIRAALATSLAAGARHRADLEPGVRLTARLSRFWDWRGSLTEAATWLERYTAAVGIPTDGHPTEVIEPLTDLGLLLGWYGFVCSELGRHEQAAALADLALELAVAADDVYAQAVVLTGPALNARIAGDPDAALTVNGEVRRRSEALGEPWMVAWADSHDALCLLALGRHDEAEAAARRSWRGFDALGDRRASAWPLTALAQILLDQERPTDALRRAEEARSVSTDVGDERNAAWSAELGAAAHRALGNEGAAEELERLAAELLSARGMPRSPWHRDQR